MNNLDGIRQKVFLDRYALKSKDGSLVEKTPEEMWKRVARGIASQEKPKDKKAWEEKFYKVLEDFKFVPGGRILSGAGTGYEVTYFNCFVIPSPKDSREGIIDSLKQLVEIQSRSGGVGLNLSSLRPRGARVKKVNGTSSGPVTWAGLFSYATHDVVQQGGTRRGATMLMLWDWHPDIEEFITVKEDLSKINGANLSVCVSDAFMKAVKEDKDWELIYPDLDDKRYDLKWEGDIDDWKKMGGKVKIYKTLKARYLWNLICTAAWKSAEPGLHFLERSNKYSNTWYFEKLVATNPSLRAGTKVLTKEGIYPIEKLDGERFYVKNLNGKWSQAECFLSGSNKKLYKITLNNGEEIFATPEHKWPVLSVGGGFGKVTTDRLRAGNILPYPKVDDIQFSSKTPRSRDEGFMLGWLYGDGWITERSQKSAEDRAPIMRNIIRSQAGFLNPHAFVKPSLNVNSDKHLRQDLDKKRMVFGFLFSEEEKSLSKVVLRQVNNLKEQESRLVKAKDNTYTIQTTSSLFAENLFTIFGVGKKEDGFPEELWCSGGDFIKGFIDGLLSSDGFISKNSRRIVLTTKHKKMAFDLSSLLSFYGIKSRIHRSEATKVKFPNSKDYSRIYERYDVYIDGYNAVRFGTIFNISHPRKKANLRKLISSYKTTRAISDNEVIRVMSVEKTNIKEDVWDISVYDDTHCFYIGHCVTGNCGEQPLGPWAVCNLGAMNLSQYVNDAELGFDFDSFSGDVKVAMRLLDNVIDDTYYFYKENEKCAKEIRRTGLGIMGLADALIKMKLRYGSDEAQEVIDKIFRVLRDSAYEESSDLAKEKGAFPKFDKNKYLEGHHIKALPKKIRDKIEKQGIRNAVLLTVAPTGTTSLVAGVSSGIEPVYEFVFKRRWRGGEDTVYHPLFEQWKKENSSVEIPEYFVSANDLTPIEHAKVQSVAQKYIDSSISKTVNAPNAHTIEDVKTLYMMSYDMGLKGITYMRDGSRQGVLERVDEKKKEEEAKRHPILKRPPVMQGFTVEKKTPLGNAFVTINQDTNGNPFELFMTIGKSGTDVSAMAEALGRVISLVLRMQSPVEARERMRQIVAQLSGIGGMRSVGFGENRVRSLPDAVAKVISEVYGFKVNGRVEDKKDPAFSSNGNGNGNGKHKTEDTQNEEKIVVEEANISEEKVMQAELHASEEQHGDICPECGVASFVHEEGCAKCYSCGYAEC